MKKYLFILQESGGCDYTIGCGINYDEVYAENIIEAYKKIADYYGIDSNYCHSDNKLYDIKCYEIDETKYIDFEDLKKELKEYNEFLKLKEKFEKME